MQNARSSHLVILALCVLLVGAAVGLASLYPRASRSLVQPHQLHLVQRAEQEAAAAFHHSATQQRRITFPIVMEMSDRTCVELRSTALDGGGNYLACYSQSGQVLEERTTSGF
jgi:hypothetical protein